MDNNDTNDLTVSLCEQVLEAYESGEALQFFGTQSKAFLGREAVGRPVDLSAHRGIVQYTPSELVITARAGTPITELKEVLRVNKQALAFDPPCFGEKGTVGGMVASGLSGPGRPWSGAVRDAVPGIRCVNGRGELLRFGGQVMKNVAGYDVSRLQAGAMGTLCLLLDVSLKLVPIAESQITLTRSCNTQKSIEIMKNLGRKSLPLSGLSHHEGLLRIRLSGNAAAVEAATKAIHYDEMVTDDGWWSALRDHKLPLFNIKGDLWRISTSTGASLNPVLGENQLIDWGGAQRWFTSNRPAEEVRTALSREEGSCTLVRARDGSHVDAPFAPLSSIVEGLHKRLKKAFDPRGILNPGRMYAGF